MATVIVLAMHGMPPKDFPHEQRRELMRLRSQIHHPQGDIDVEQQNRHDELDAKMRQWPRTEQNDPFHAAAVKLADELEKTTRLKVFLGFNEFCSPSFKDALNQAAQSGPQNIHVVTPMMTRGGSHSEIDIPKIIEEIRKEYSKIHFKYIWPFETKNIAQFLADHIRSSTSA